VSTGSAAAGRSRPPLALGVTGALVATAMVLPIGHLVVRASETNDVIRLVASERTLGLVSSTLRLALASTVLAVVLGAGIAWLVERTDLPARRVLGLAAVLPLVVPSYVAALAVVAAFGPRGLAFEVPGLLGFWGAVVALGLSSYPYVLLLSRAALARVDPALEEAARALGDGNSAVFGRVLLPQLRPAITAGGLLVFLYVLSDFGAVAILRYDTLTRAIFTEVRSNFSNRGAPAVLGVVLVVFTLVAIGVERRLRGRPAPSRAVAGVRPVRRVALGRWRWPAMAWVMAVVTAGLGVPLGVIGYWATVGTSNADPGSVLARAATTSMGLSMAAAIVAAGVAVPVAVLAVRHRSSFSRVVETLSV
jgi:iron(III) transport system permease protein